jgi:hypothetical protein
VALEQEGDFEEEASYQLSQGHPALPQNGSEPRSLGQEKLRSPAQQLGKADKDPNYRKCTCGKGCESGSGCRLVTLFPARCDTC